MKIFCKTIARQSLLCEEVGLMLLKTVVIAVNICILLYVYQIFNLFIILVDPRNSEDNTYKVGWS